MSALDVLFGLTIMWITFAALLALLLSALGELPLWVLAVSVPALALFSLAWYAGVKGGDQ